MKVLTFFAIFVLVQGLRDIEFVYSKALKWLRLAKGRKSEIFESSVMTHKIFQIYEKLSATVYEWQMVLTH